MSAIYAREDWTLFRTLASLTQKAGVPERWLPAVAVKELVDNALDARARCDVGLLDGNGFWVKNDGKGIEGTDADIAGLFSFHRPLMSSKLVRLPTRGALGNGLRIVAGLVFASGGSLILGTGGRTLRLTPQLDGTTLAERIGPFDEAGTYIEIRLGDTLSVAPGTLNWARRAIALAAGGSTYPGKSSPHWYDTDAFFEVLQAAGPRTVRDVMGDFDGCTGPKASRLATAFKQRLAKELTRPEVGQLLECARKLAKPVKPERLGFLGTSVEGWPASYAKVVGTIPSRVGRGKQNAEIPFVLEAYAEVAEHASLEVSVNRTPITGDVSAYHDEGDLCLIGCGLQYACKIGRRPIRVCFNIQTPCMPITSDGKAPDLGRFARGIGSAVEKAVKRAKSSAPRGAETKAETQKDIILRCLDEAIDKTSGGRKFRFSLRQVYYAVRPHVQNSGTKTLGYDYFANVITDYEAEHGDIEGMYRDARGTLYHPHTREEIPLGTLQVERYLRPDYMFNKVLYCEKEGIFPILKSVRWPERHDCALMTSKGFASRAARDLIDALGESGEAVQVFCVHDADAAGTMILQALQRATAARGKRRIEVINLGLDPQEAEQMGLEVENVERKKAKRQPVADYIDGPWRDWLQDKRIELNAMTTPQLLEWLDKKMELYAGKLVPPEPVLARNLEECVRTKIEQKVTARVLQEANIPEQVATEFHSRQPLLQVARETLPADVRESLDQDPSRHWLNPVGGIADEIAGTTAA